MGLLYGRTGRLTAENGNSRPGQFAAALPAVGWPGGCVAPQVLPASVFFGQHVSMYGAVTQSSFAYVLLGINSILTWMKLLKYLNAFPHMAMMTKTVTYAMAPSLSFLMMFFVFFMGYAQGLTMVFGGAIRDYSNIKFSMMSLFRALIGDFDVEAMMKADKFVGPVLFIIFIMVGMIFLINIFIAVLTESYDKAKIQVFGDAFDEREKRWEGAPTFIDYFRESYTRLAARAVSVVRRRQVAQKVLISPRVIAQMKRWAQAAVKRVVTGNRILQKDSTEFSISEHVKNIEHWLTADGQRMQRHLADLSEQLAALHQLNLAQSQQLLAHGQQLEALRAPAAGRPPLPPLKV
jgi:hypothetical protein